MSKFAKKEKDVAEKPAKKEKPWTNDPSLQDQETGETTAKGKAKAPKAAKEAPAKAKGKAAPAPKAAANDTRKITLITKDNPKREGSAAYDRFELYRKNKTVAAFYEAGGSSADLRYDEKAGHISLA